MNDTTEIRKTFASQMTRKFLRFTCIFFAVALVLHNVLACEIAEPKEFHLGTFLLGMSFVMFLFWYYVKKKLPETFHKGVFTVKRSDVDGDVVCLESQETGVSLQIPKDQYLSSIKLENNGMQVVALGSFICKVDDKIIDDINK